jgi:phosphoribosyl 1,2-cyclic phosphodiesterase
MDLHFSVLASGSRGNSALVRADGPGLLIDLGLAPRTIRHRLRTVGAGWSGIGAALLTHTHGDHVCNPALLELARRRIPLYCHESHPEALGHLPGLVALREAGLVRPYGESPFLTPGGFRIESIELAHDSGPTFGFRLEAKCQPRRPPVTLGYVADTGHWTPAMAEPLRDVDLLGLEFNHDVALQRRSSRPPVLIHRILGRRGHLSNDEAAELVAEVVRAEPASRLRHVVLLHLSQECNRPELAVDAARRALRGTRRRIGIHVARQDEACPHLTLSPPTRTVLGRTIGAGPRPARTRPKASTPILTPERGLFVGVVPGE